MLTLCAPCACVCVCAHVAAHCVGCPLCCLTQGAISFKTNPGAFQNKYKLEFWVYVGVAGWEGTAAKGEQLRVV